MLLSPSLSTSLSRQAWVRGAGIRRAVHRSSAQSAGFVNHTRHNLFAPARPARWSSTITNQSASSASASPAPSIATRSRLRRFLTTTSLFVILSLAGFSMAAAPAAEAINGMIKPPTDAETLGLYEPETDFAAQVNDHIVNHPLAQKLRARPEMTEARAHMKIPAAVRVHNLTAGVLVGEDKLEVPPLAFNDKDAELPSMTQILYVGPALCGHPNIVHGGLLATLMDEGLARACFPALPHKVGVTASLKIDYRSPCPAKSYLVLKAHTTKVEGRKVWVKGTIEVLGETDATGPVLVEAEALFVEPRNVSHLPKAYTQ